MIKPFARHPTHPAFESIMIHILTGGFSVNSPCVSMAKCPYHLQWSISFSPLCSFSQGQAWWTNKGIPRFTAVGKTENPAQRGLTTSGAVWLNLQAATGNSFSHMNFQLATDRDGQHFKYIYTHFLCNMGCLPLSGTVFTWTSSSLIEKSLLGHKVALLVHRVLLGYRAIL